MVEKVLLLKHVKNFISIMYMELEVLIKMQVLIRILYMLQENIFQKVVLILLID